MKKISIIGRGTAGCLAVAHFLHFTDWPIDFYYDNQIKPQAVGEGSNLTLPMRLNQTINFLNNSQSETVILVDSFENPVRVNRAELLAKLNETYESVMTEWLNEWAELEKKR